MSSLQPYGSSIFIIPDRHRVKPVAQNRQVICISVLDPPYHSFTTPLHSGYAEQPQNRFPTVLPVLAVRSTM